MRVNEKAFSESDAVAPSRIGWRCPTEQTSKVKLKATSVVIGRTPTMLRKTSCELLILRQSNVKQHFAAIDVVCAIDLIDAVIRRAIERRNIIEAMRATPVDVDNKFLALHVAHEMTVRGAITVVQHQTMAQVHNRAKWMKWRKSTQSILQLQPASHVSHREMVSTALCQCLALANEYPKHH